MTLKRQFELRRAILFLIPVLLVWTRGASPALAAPPTLEAYKQLVAESYAAAQRSDRIGLDDRAAQLIAATSVLMPDGTTVAVDNGWLRTALAAEPPDFPTITAQLGAILDALGQSRTQTDTQALQKLNHIYEVPPFKSRALPSVWDRFWAAVGRAIGRFFEQMVGNLPTPNIAPGQAQSFNSISPLGWLLLIVGLLLVLLIIVYAVRSIRRSIVADKRIREQAAEEETLSTAEAIELAQTGARAGDYRNAARYLYLSSLLWLEERGVLRYDRSRTNREYLAQLQGKPAHSTLAPVVDTFERVWYGQRPLDADGFEQYEQAVAALRAQEERPK